MISEEDMYDEVIVNAKCDNLKVHSRFRNIIRHELRYRINSYVVILCSSGCYNKVDGELVGVRHTISQVNEVSIDSCESSL